MGDNGSLRFADARRCDYGLRPGVPQLDGEHQGAAGRSSLTSMRRLSPGAAKRSSPDQSILA